MKSSLNFLAAALQCEIDELEYLAVTCELVDLLGQLIHALQKERGLTNVWLASRGERFADQRLEQARACLHIEQQARERLDALDTEAGRARNGARLFSRVAVALHGLDTLPALRERVAQQALTPEESAAAFARLIARLLAVVFEAADNATDPGISRALVALFNFMQGKEFAGQERALGSAVFASGQLDEARLQTWLHLIESQESCFQVFDAFCDDTARPAWHAMQHAEILADLERLRHIARAAPADGRLDADLSPVWFDICTQRIDMMREIEDLLAQNLRVLCERKIAQARAESRDQQATLEALGRAAADQGETATYGPHLERSILMMAQEQSRRLQAMSDELDAVRATLNERKIIERAKGLLMAARKLNEDDAYKMLRQTAMNQGKRLIDVARTVLSMSEYL